MILLLLIIFIFIPAAIVSFGVVSLGAMLERLLIASPFLIAIIFALLIHGKRKKAKERKDATKEAQLFLNLYETDYRLVQKPEEVIKFSHQYARKLGISTDDASLTAAYRKGFADITAVQDAIFKAEFPDDKVAEYVYFHKHDHDFLKENSHAIDLMKNQLPSKLYAKNPGVGSCWIRKELHPRVDALGKYLKGMLYTDRIILNRPGAKRPEMILLITFKSA